MPTNRNLYNDGQIPGVHPGLTLVKPNGDGTYTAEKVAVNELWLQNDSRMEVSYTYIQDGDKKLPAVVYTVTNPRLAFPNNTGTTNK